MEDRFLLHIHSESVDFFSRWVVFIECKISEMEMKLMMYSECLKRLRRQLSVLQQLHLAASTYMTAVTEVVRRRAFSQAFLVVSK